MSSFPFFRNKLKGIICFLFVLLMDTVILVFIDIDFVISDTVNLVFMIYIHVEYVNLRSKGNLKDI